jgi:hypothetical protein
MFRQIGSRPSFLCLCIAAACLWAGPAIAQYSQAVHVAQASTSDVSEKKAFEAAKELGTIEALEAFLTNFPKGFRADLARAYVRRLGSGQAKPEAQSAPVPQPFPQPPQQAATPPPPPAPPLPPVDLGLGTTPSRMGTYAFDGGDATPPAIVYARGVRLSAYCTAQRAIQFVISDKHDGVFPEFDARTEQGFAAAGGNGNAGNSANIPIVFRNGQQVFVQESAHSLTGELARGDTDSVSARPARSLNRSWPAMP